ncbi:MAG: DUF222 domain-containing protein, partial [Microthrixaceae bacterium]
MRTMTEAAARAEGSVEAPPGVVGSVALVGEGEVSAMPMERLEEEMRGLAGHLAAATCAFLVLVGEYDARGGWQSWEALSCAHWLNWRCGVGMVAAREQVRVARRLRELPVVRAEFAAGRLSYSKVRAITRVAHPAIEEGLVHLAQAATAAQLERACSALRRCQDLVEAEAVIREGEDRSIERRSLQWSTDSATGELIVRLRIPGGVDAEGFRSTIEGFMVTEAADGEQLADIERRRLDALLDAVAAGRSTDATLATQPEVVVHVQAPVPTGPAPIAPPGTPPSAPSSAPPSGRSSASPSAAVPDGHGDDPRWPYRTDRGTLLSAVALSELLGDAGSRVVLDVPLAETALAGPSLETWSPLRLLSGLVEPSFTLDLGRHRRHPTPALRRAVMRRDGGCCRFPGCTRRHRLHVHHNVFWEHGGRTDMDNLIVLCPAHHGAIHRRGWRLTGSAAEP